MAKNCYLFICVLFFSTGISNAQSGNTSRTRDRVTKIYTSKIGVRELTEHNDGTDVEMFLRYCGLSKGQPWCASFVCWAFGQSKIANPRSGYCPDLFNAKAIIWQRNKKSSIIPLQADVFGLYFPEKGRIAHVGFINRWGNTSVVTVEGNTNMAGSREGDGVYRKVRLTRQVYAVARYIK